MTRRKRKITDLHSGSLNEDDGIDPRYYFAEGRRDGRNHRKAYQLCRQVMETLHYVLHDEEDIEDDGLSDENALAAQLATDQDDSSELLSSLMVREVLPAPDTSRLLVVVQTDLPQASPNEIVELLEAQSGRLRTEIARSIHRKKTPQLIFQVVMPGELSTKDDD